MEHGIFTPIGFFFGKWWGSWDFHVPQTYCFIANKREKYEKVQILIRCKLSFLILRSVLLGIRGSPSISKDSVVLDDVSLTCSATGLF